MPFFADDAQYQNVNLALKLNLLDVPGWIRGLANVLFPGISTDTPSGWSQPGSPGAYYELGWLSHGIFGMFDTINVWGFRDDTITDFGNGNDVLKFSRNPYGSLQDVLNGVLPASDGSGVVLNNWNGCTKLEGYTVDTFRACVSSHAGSIQIV